MAGSSASNDEATGATEDVSTTEKDDVEENENIDVDVEELPNIKTAEAVIGDDNLIEIEDPDDYLMYLEAILQKIHARFYKFYDENKQVR